MKNKIELLAPAGNLEKAKFAINFGANAIYLGGKIFSLRAQSTNFALKTIKTIIDYAHKKHCKVYIVVNILCHNSFLKQLKPYLLQLNVFNPDGLIVADPFVIQMAKKYCPNVELHLSTQQSITNHKAALFFKKNGIKRVITAREVDYKNLTSLCKHLNILSMGLYVSTIQENVCYPTILLYVMLMLEVVLNVADEIEQFLIRIKNLLVVIFRWV